MFQNKIQKSNLVLMLAISAFIIFFGCNSDNQLTEVKDLNNATVNMTSKRPTGVSGTVEWEWNKPVYFPWFALFWPDLVPAQQKIQNMLDHYFNIGSPNSILQRYNDYEYYIYDDVHGDIRSEGQSYGMMIAVQLGMQDEFDKIWNFTYKHMKHSNNLIAWQIKPDLTGKDDNSASDGEEWIAMALWFAHHRWGSGTGTDNYKNYKYWAESICDAMLSNMFGSENLIYFQPTDHSKTDPSYVTPLFYELFSLYTSDSTKKARWKEIATAGRTFLRNTLLKKYSSGGTVNGLVSCYSNFDGSPIPGDHNNFEYDAWRVVMNVSLDNMFYYNTEAQNTYGSWDASHSDPVFVYGYAHTLLDFFNSKNSGSAMNYPDLYSLEGSASGSSHRLGLVACNSFGAPFAPDIREGTLMHTFLSDLWNSSLIYGSDRYYHGLLYMLAMTYATGQFNIRNVSGGGTVSPMINKVVERNLSSHWSGKFLTVTSTESNADVKAQPMNTAWSSQDWILEPVAESPFFRLKNVWSGKYLHVQNQNENAKIVCYNFEPEWLSMQWKIEPVPNTTRVRLKNAWSGKYLTVENTGNYANMWAQSLNTGWASQEWNLTIK